MSIIKRTIILSGPDGNAFTLLSIAKDISNANGYDWNPIYEEMISGDYDHLVEVMENYFSEYITLVN